MAGKQSKDQQTDSAAPAAEAEQLSRFDQLVAEKVKAGLDAASARSVAQAQIDHDAALAAKQKKTAKA